MEIIKLNIIPSGVNPTCHASQYDEGRVIRVELFEGLAPFTLQANDEIGLSIRKPDDKIVTMLVENTEDNYVDIVTTKQACAVIGANLCELTIKRSSVTIGTLNFYMQVERDPLADGDDSESEIRDLQERVNACVEIALEDLYDGTSVLFDAEPVLDHDEPYTVTSNGIAQAFGAVNTALAGKVDNSALTANYYNKTQVDNALNGKVDNSELDYYYTKLETYSKTEINNAFSSLATVAATGSYNDLINTPTIPAAQVNSDWNATSGVAEILNKPTVAANASELPYESGSQITTKGKIDALTPLRYRYVGQILDSNGGTIKGCGEAVITLQNGIARIDFGLMIETADDTSNEVWGINSNFFTATVGKTISASFGGVATFYTAAGAINGDRHGYCGNFTTIASRSNYWKPSRVYKSGSKPDSYSTGSWASGLFGVGQRIIGTCWGTYT